MSKWISGLFSSGTASNGAKSLQADQSKDSHTADPDSPRQDSDTTCNLQEKKDILVDAAKDEEADQSNDSLTADPDSSLQLSDTTLNLEQKKEILIEAAKKHYKNRFSTLMPIPYMKDKNVCVNDVFVEVGADNYVTNPLVKKGGKWKRLSSYSNIFIDDRTKFKRRIITADAGCGKSTMTLQLAYDWCNGVKGSAFENVELLILLQLRQLGGLKSIYSAIKMILVPGDRQIKSSDIKSIIESCSSVEVLLDGYDEYSRTSKTSNVSFVDHIISGEMFENINVTLTSRYRPKDYDKLNTKLVRLVGLDDDARDQYIRKAFNELDKENVAKIKRGLASNPFLDDLCQVPLFCVMFAHMIHDGHDLQQFHSVTNLFRYTIKCFHSHKRNKSLDKNTAQYFTQYETEHRELNKLALQGLTKEKQQLSWRKDELYERIGRECCDHHLSVGVFVQGKEFDVINDTESGNEGLKEMDIVRYYRKIFCEYYAAHGVVDLYSSGGSDRLQEICNKMDPFDIQYVYRISCGIDPKVGKEIISHLKSRKDCDSLVALCIMEKDGDVTVINKFVRQLCSNAVYLKNGESRLLQRSTLHFLEIASEYDIPISNLILDESFKHVHEKKIILRSDMTLKNLTTLEKLGIDTEPGRKLTGQEVVDLILYGKQSKIFKELRFYNCPLPLSMDPDTIPEELKKSDVKVMLPSFGHRLDLKTGKWIKATDVATISDLCADYICIDNSNQRRLQKLTIELLRTASDKNIRISQLYLYQSLKSVEKEGITLRSELQLTSLSTLETIGIETEAGRDFTQREISDIMAYAGQSRLLKNLSFYYQLLPYSISVGSIPSELKSRKVSVHWFPNSKDGYYYNLSLNVGRWFKKGGVALNEEEYAVKERNIKEYNEK